MSNHEEIRRRIQDKLDELTRDDPSVLLEAHGLVHGPRQADYGHPRVDFARTAAMWSAILGVYVPVWKVPLCMAALKISRECQKHKRDNLVDGAGYLETCRMVREDPEGGPQ
jgi:hypothetical protein